MARQPVHLDEAAENPALACLGRLQNAELFGRQMALDGAVLAAVVGPMTSAETLVLLAAALLVLAVFVEAGKGTIRPRAGKLLLGLAVLAVFVALLHMEVRVMATTW